MVAIIATKAEFLVAKNFEPWDDDDDDDDDMTYLTRKNLSATAAIKGCPGQLKI